ncbi:hypothetical protein [Leifsonia sp. LS-T14]|uniref:hypothetical protein n=1 Tax=unclassified Leifsonia TaxID=2663824 RepID=UPI0035A5CD96
MSTSDGSTGVDKRVRVAEKRAWRSLLITLGAFSLVIAVQELLPQIHFLWLTAPVAGVGGAITGGFFVQRWSIENAAKYPEPSSDQESPGTGSHH